MTKTKVNILVFLLLSTIISLKVIGQESNWYKFELEKIKIDFPTKKVYQLDTIISGHKMIQLCAKIGYSRFCLQKLLIEDSLENKSRSSLPYDYKSLIKFYSKIINSAKNNYNAEYIYKEEIKLGGLIGYKSIIYNNLKNPLIELRIFLIENNLITQSIYQAENKSTKIKEKFFNSIDFNSLNSLEQYTTNSKSYKLGYLFGKSFVYIILSTGFLLLIIVLRKK